MISFKIGDQLEPDIEREYGGDNGFQDGYIFEQSQKKCTIIIKFEPQVKSIEIDFQLNQNENTITVGLMGQKPILVGKIFSSCSRNSLNYQNGLFTLILSKETYQKWPLFIIAPNEKNLIDPKSRFILSLYEKKSGKYDLFLNDLHQSIVQNYKPSRQYFLTTIAPDPKYSHPNLLPIFELFNPIEFSESAIKSYCDILHQEKRYIDENSILAIVSNQSYSLMLRRALLCSPLTGELNDLPTTIKLLNLLSEVEEPEGLWFLGHHYEFGIGVKKDLKKAKDLKKRAHEKDPSLKEMKENHDHHYIAGGLAALTALSAFFLISKMKK